MTSVEVGLSYPKASYSGANLALYQHNQPFPMTSNPWNFAFDLPVNPLHHNAPSQSETSLFFQRCEDMDTPACPTLPDQHFLAVDQESPQIVGRSERLGSHSSTSLSYSVSAPCTSSPGFPSAPSCFPLPAPLDLSSGPSPNDGLLHGYHHLSPNPHQSENLLPTGGEYPFSGDQHFRLDSQMGNSIPNSFASTSSMQRQQHYPRSSSIASAPGCSSVTSVDHTTVARRCSQDSYLANREPFCLDNLDQWSGSQLANSQVTVESHPHTQPYMGTMDAYVEALQSICASGEMSPSPSSAAIIGDLSPHHTMNLPSRHSQYAGEDAAFPRSYPSSRTPSISTGRPRSHSQVHIPTHRSNPSPVLRPAVSHGSPHPFSPFTPSLLPIPTPKISFSTSSHTPDPPRLNETSRLWPTYSLRYATSGAEEFIEQGSFDTEGELDEIEQSCGSSHSSRFALSPANRSTTSLPSALNSSSHFSRDNSPALPLPAKTPRKRRADPDGDLLTGGSRETNRQRQRIDAFALVAASASGKRRGKGRVKAELQDAIPHMHVLNVLCPHPTCTFFTSSVASDNSPLWIVGPLTTDEAIDSSAGSETALEGRSKKKGGSNSRVKATKRTTKVFKCWYIEPLTGRECPSTFRRRACRDRHTASHSGRESKDVCNSYLALEYARRLLWETCRLVQAMDWTCLYASDIPQMTSSIPGDQLAVPSQNEAEYLARAGQRYLECKRRIEEEFDMPVLLRQTETVRARLLEDTFYGTGIQAQSAMLTINPTGKNQPIPAIELQGFHQFCRLAEKRATSFERYYCIQSGCGMDFTRLDALMRHNRTCQVGKSKGKGKKSSVMEGLHGSDLEEPANDSDEEEADEEEEEE